MNNEFHAIFTYKFVILSNTFIRLKIILDTNTWESSISSKFGFNIYITSAIIRSQLLKHICKFHGLAP